MFQERKSQAFFSGKDKIWLVTWGLMWQEGQKSVGTLTVSPESYWKTDETLDEFELMLSTNAEEPGSPQALREEH